MKSSLLLAASAGALGASFFIGKPTLHQRVMTRFDVISIEAAKRKRERRLMRKYQEAVLAKEEQKCQKVDVLIIDSGPGPLVLTQAQSAIERMVGVPLVLLNERMAKKQPTADFTMLEALAQLHTSWR